MMRKFAAILLGLVAAAEAEAQWGPYRQPSRGGGGGLGGIQLGGRYRQWTPEIEGDLEAEDGGVGGSELDLESTLGIDDKERMQEIALWVPNLPYIGAVNFAYLRGGYEGEATLAADTTYSGTFFAAGTAIGSEVDWKVYTFLWEYQGQIPGLGNVGAQTGVSGLVGLKFIDLETNVESAADDADADLRAWIPVIGVRTRFTLAEWLTLEAEIVGTRAVGISGVEGVLYDLALGGQIRHSGLFAGAGYRWFSIDVEDTSAAHADELEFDVKLKGVYFEAGVRF